MAVAMTRKRSTSRKFQVIYAAALRMPSEGYAESDHFRPSIGSCPSCGANAFVRIRFRTGTILGCACDSCPWFMTYLLKPKLPAAAPQLFLDL